MITGIFIFLFGLIVGSFLNVCIYRMGREMSINKPERSFCPACKKSILWFDNIPILSFISLGGRCRFCKAKISFRYPLVELLTGLLFILLFKYFGVTLKFFIYSLFTSALIVAAFIDIDFQIIPDEISIGGAIFGFLISMAFPVLHNTNSHLFAAGKSLLGLLVGGGVIYILGIIGDIIFKKESMGGGDVKLLAMIGAFLGWQKALLTFFIAPFLGSIISILINSGKLNLKEPDGTVNMSLKKISKTLFTGVIPYGPFLCMGALVSLLYIDKILNLVFYYKI